MSKEDKMLRQDKILALALEYQKQYNETPWWRFKKRAYYKAMLKSALDYIVGLNS
jgi:hypothetical protein